MEQEKNFDFCRHSRDHCTIDEYDDRVKRLLNQSYDI